MFYNHFNQVSNGDISKLLKMIVDIVRFESITELTFDYLKVIAPSKEEEAYLQLILDDEREHIDELKKIYFSITSQQPLGDSPTFAIPESYIQGIKDIFQQKQEIINIYKSMKRMSPFIYIKEKMVDFIQDEIRHLAILNHLLHISHGEEREYRFECFPKHLPPMTFS